MKRNTGGRVAAFTLVEIMIVVAIIGLLATMAIPSLARARAEAYKTTCINNLRQIDSAIQRWALVNKQDTGQAVTYADIRDWLQNRVVCPSGGKTFEDSYRITTVDERPVCLRQPERHKLD